MKINCANLALNIAEPVMMLIVANSGFNLVKYSFLIPFYSKYNDLLNAAYYDSSLNKYIICIDLVKLVIVKLNV